MEASLGLTALLLSLPANQRVASRVDLEVKAPRLPCLAGFWVKKSRYFSEFHPDEISWVIGFSIHSWFWAFWGEVELRGGHEKCRLQISWNFEGKWRDSSKVSHISPRATPTNHLWRNCTIFLFPQSQWLVCALGPISNNFEMLSDFFSEVYVFRYIFCLEHWMKPFVKYMKK